MFVFAVQQHESALCIHIFPSLLSLALPGAVDPFNSTRILRATVTIVISILQTKLRHVKMKPLAKGHT